MYEIIEKNQYGVLVRDEKDQFEYYLSALEAEKLESETSDTQKELIDLRVELRVEKEKSKALEEYSRGLELKVKELEICATHINHLKETKMGCFAINVKNR